MWNFAGRQNGIQGNGELEHGNWITGIPFIDNARLGRPSKLPDDLKADKAHNVFYCLPLLLGLIGLFWQAFRGRRGIRQFWVVFFLFFATGLAIVILSEPDANANRVNEIMPMQVRSMPSPSGGIGVAGIPRFGLRNIHGRHRGFRQSLDFCVCVPIQMISQTYDDHDRSRRYTCRDFGQNYLMTLQDKGISYHFHQW